MPFWGYRLSEHFVTFNSSLMNIVHRFRILQIVFVSSRHETIELCVENLYAWSWWYFCYTKTLHKIQFKTSRGTHVNTIHINWSKHKVLKHFLIRGNISLLFFFQSFSLTKYRWNNRTWKLNRSIYIEMIELINFELDPIRTNSLHVAHFLIAIRNKSNRNT